MVRPGGVEPPTFGSVLRLAALAQDSARQSAQISAL